MEIIETILNTLYFFYDCLPILAEGLKITLITSVSSFALGLLIGSAVALLRVAKIKFLHYLLTAYVEVIRGTPLLVQLLFIFYGIPIVFGIKMPSLIVGIVAIGICTGAYQSEMIRSGIQSIPEGQIEASQALGMTKWQTMQFIVLPQALRMVIPTLINEFIMVTKDTSQLMVIAIPELTRRGSWIVYRTFKPFQVFGLVGAMYFVIAYVASRLSKYIENKYRIRGLIR